MEIEMLLIGIMVLIIGYWVLRGSIKDYIEAEKNNEDQNAYTRSYIIGGIIFTILGILGIIWYFKETFFS